MLLRTQAGVQPAKLKLKDICDLVVVSLLPAARHQGEEAKDADEDVGTCGELD